MFRKSTIAAALELADLVRPAWPEISAGIARSGVPTCEVAEAPLKEKLKKIDGELAKARDDRVGLAKARDDARDKFAGSESLSQDSDEFKEANQAVRELGECDDKIADLQAVQVATLRMLGKDTPAAARGHDRASGDSTDPRGGWDSASIFADEDMRTMLAHMSGSKAKIGPVQLGEVASRERLVADISGSPFMRRGDYVGILPQLRRQLTVLDLVPTGTMDQNSIPYTEESGSLDTAVETAEGAAKPEAAWTPTDKEAFARTIAHWQKLRKQVLADFPALQSIIDNRLRYGVERRLEGQILNGNGVGDNLQGILQTSGIGAVVFDAGELPADQILTGITSVLLADAMADGIIMHPTDWAAALKVKADDGSGGGDLQYYSGGPFRATPQVMWGLPLIPSKAIPQGTVLVGDFAIGVQLFIREGVNVLLSDSDQDDFIKNRVTILAEMRAALPVWRPPAFSAVDIAA